MFKDPKIGVWLSCVSLPLHCKTITEQFCETYWGSFENVKKVNEDVDRHR